MSRTKNAVWGFVADICGQVFTQFLNFAFIPIYLTYITEKDYGYWLTIGSIMTWLAISDVGIGMALNRYLMSAQLLPSDERELNVNKLINTSGIIFFIIAIVFCLVGLIMYPFTLNWFNISDAFLTEYRATYFIAIVACALALPLSVFNGILESVQKIALNRNLVTISSVVNALVALVLIRYLKTSTALAYGLLAAVISRGIISYYYAYKAVKFRWSYKNFDKKYAKELLSFGGYFQISRVANTIAENTDTLFIAMFLGASIVPIYSFSSKLTQVICITIASKIATSLFSGISQLIDQKDYLKLKLLFCKLSKLLVRFAIFSAAFIFFFNKTFVSLWVGEKYYGGDWLNYVFVYWILYETFFRGTTIIIYALKEVKGLAIASILEAIINTVLSVLLIKKYGLMGVAIATSIARTFFSGIYIVHIYLKYKLIDKHFFSEIASTLLLSIPTILFFIFIAIYYLHLSWTGLVVMGMIGAFINLLSFEGIIFYKNRKQPLRTIINNIVNYNFKLQK